MSCQLQGTRLQAVIDDGVGWSGVGDGTGSIAVGEQTSATRPCAADGAIDTAMEADLAVPMGLRGGGLLPSMAVTNPVGCNAGLQATIHLTILSPIPLALHSQGQPFQTSFSAHPECVIYRKHRSTSWIANEPIFSTKHG